jgi:hypothetical protein
MPLFELVNAVSSAGKPAPALGLAIASGEVKINTVPATPQRGVCSVTVLKNVVVKAPAGTRMPDRLISPGVYSGRVTAVRRPVAIRGRARRFVCAYGGYKFEFGKRDAYVARRGKLAAPGALPITTLPTLPGQPVLTGAPGSAQPLINLNVPGSKPAGDQGAKNGQGKRKGCKGLRALRKLIKEGKFGKQAQEALKKQKADKKAQKAAAKKAKQDAKRQQREARKAARDAKKKADAAQTAQQQAGTPGQPVSAADVKKAEEEAKKAEAHAKRLLAQARKLARHARSHPRKSSSGSKKNKKSGRRWPFFWLHKKQNANKKNVPQGAANSPKQFLVKVELPNGRVITHQVQV